VCLSISYITSACSLINLRQVYHAPQVCHAIVKRDSTALPQEFAIAYGKAYAIGTDIDIKNPADYRLNAYDKESDLYIFNENVNFHEGLEQVFRILLEQSFKGFEPSKVEPVIDVGIPPIEILREVFDSVLKHFLRYQCLFFHQPTM